MQNLEQFTQHLKNLQAQNKKTVTVDVNWLYNQLTNTVRESHTKGSTLDGGKFMQDDLSTDK